MNTKIKIEMNSLDWGGVKLSSKTKNWVFEKMNTFLTNITNKK